MKKSDIPDAEAVINELRKVIAAKDEYPYAPIQMSRDVVDTLIEVMTAQRDEIAKQETIELTCDTFCDWVRRLKEEGGYTIKAFAAKTGMSTYAITRYTERNLLPSLYSLERIAKAFGKHIMIR